MGPGRKGKPRNLVLIQNGRASRQARDLRDDEPQPPVNAPDPPEYLGEEAKAAFRLFAGRLATYRVMTDMDTEGCALLAQSFADWKDACAKVAANPILRTPSGYIQVSPFVAMKNKAWEQVSKMLSEFGLTPSARRKVSSQ